MKITEKEPVTINLCQYVIHDDIFCQENVDSDHKYCVKHSKFVENDIELFKQVLEHFRQDIREFFVRSNFYFVCETGLVYAVFSKGLAKTTPDFIIAICGNVLGIIISLFWYFVASGAIIWINEWRLEAIRLDKMVSRFHSYARLETQMRKNLWNYPSEVTRYLTVAFLMFWVVLLIFNVLFYKQIIQ